jgi:hypothetical protein
MVTNTKVRPTPSEWHAAKGLFPCAREAETGLHGALIPDGQQDNDFIAVVYDKGEKPPEITIQEVSGSVHTVWANGVAIAIVANASGPAPDVNDVLLVERSS